MKYNTYYRELDNRVLTNWFTTFLIVSKNPTRVQPEGERIIYKKHEIQNILQTSR